jgi:hypothetical protein
MPPIVSPSVAGSGKLSDHVNFEPDVTGLQFLSLEKSYRPYDRKNSEL